VEPEVEPEVDPVNLNLSQAGLPGVLAPANALDGHLLICDCDGVLIDSEAIAGRMLVQEMEALWPGVDAEPIVTPLLGLRIETVLLRTAETLGRTLDPGQIDAIRVVVEAAAVEGPAVDGIEAALAAISLRKACASNSFTSYVEAVLNRTGLVRFFGERLFCADKVPNPKPARGGADHAGCTRTLRGGRRQRDRRHRSGGGGHDRARFPGRRSCN
jgi:hypothetical protein